MSTSALPRGKTIDFLLKKESAYGSAPSGDWTKTYVYSYDPGFKDDLVDDPLLGLTRNNNRDSTEPAPGLVTVDPKAVVPVDFNHFGLWLYAMFGAASVTGSGDPYTHVFTSGLEVLPWRSHETKMSSALFFNEVGNVGSKISVDIQHAAGFQRASLEFMGKKQNKLTATGGGTPTAPWARDECVASLGVYKINGTVVANLMSVKAVYDNKLAPQDYVSGDGFRSGADLDQEATWTGSVDLRFIDSTYYDLAVAGTVFSGEMLWSKSGSRSLSFLSPAKRLLPTGIAVAAAGKIQQTFSFRAEQPADGSAPMLTTTLKSLVPSYSL